MLNLSASILRRCWSRCQSSATNCSIKIDVNKDTDITKVLLASPPVNALNYEMFMRFQSVLNHLEKDQCRGMILTSELSNIFCGGFDLAEVHKVKKDRFIKFWNEFQNSWMKLYLTPYPTVAAINGHSPAGGCVLALSCDYRIMLDNKSKIGLNETQLGITAPQWLMNLMKDTIGSRQAELALVSGKLFTAREAYEIGLVDELAFSQQEMMEKASNFLKQESKIPNGARSLSKIAYRQNSVNLLAENKEADATLFLDTISQPQAQNAIESYLSKMKMKKQ